MITINLPAETISSIININSTQLIIPIEEAVKNFNNENNEPIQSMWANPKSLGSYIEWNYDTLYINKIIKYTCKNTEKTDHTSAFRVPLKYWRLHLRIL